MTIQSVLHASKLDRLDTELLLAYILGTDRSYIKSHPKRRLTLREQLRFLYVVWLRRHNTPIAYITGHKEFFGLDFEVNKHTLVPRPETELLVELVQKQVTNIKDTNTVLIDIGTGSGCIPVSLSVILSNAKDPLVQPTSDNERDPSVATLTQDDKVKILASDISKQALKIASRNAKKHNADIRFKRGNLLKPWSHEIMKQWGHVIVTANLPYITEQQWEQEASIKKEPKSALVADEHGLALYRELLEQLLDLNIQSAITLYFEIDPDQAPHIAPLVDTYFMHADTCIHPDFSGLARIVEIHIDNPIPA